MQALIRHISGRQMLGHMPGYVPSYMLKNVPVMHAPATHAPEYLLKHFPKHMLSHMPDKHMLEHMSGCMPRYLFKHKMTHVVPITYP